MTKQSGKMPTDLNRLASRIADMATNEEDPTLEDDGKDPAAVSLGRRGGLKGGVARAAALSSERRREIARKAAVTRWKRETTDGKTDEQG